MANEKKIPAYRVSYESDKTGEQKEVAYKTDLFGTSQNYKFEKSKSAYKQAKEYKHSDKKKEAFVRSSAYKRGVAFDVKRSLQKVGQLSHEFTGDPKRDKVVRDKIMVELSDANQKINNVTFRKKGQPRKKFQKRNVEINGALINDYDFKRYK